MRNYFATELRKTENVVIPSFVETTSYEVVDHCRGQNVGDTLTDNSSIEFTYNKTAFF
jgi:hypothetical protein